MRACPRARTAAHLPERLPGRPGHAPDVPGTPPPPYRSQAATERPAEGGPMDEITNNGAGQSASDAAVAASWEAHAAGLERYVRSLVRDPDEAADVCQEAFVRLLVAGREDRLPDSPAAWLRRVAHNLVVSGHRHRQIGDRLMSRMVEDESGSSLEEHAIRHEENTALVAALARRDRRPHGDRPGRSGLPRRRRSRSGSDDPSWRRGRCSAGLAAGSAPGCPPRSRSEVVGRTVGLPSGHRRRRPPGRVPVRRRTFGVASPIPRRAVAPRGAAADDLDAHAQFPAASQKTVFAGR